jgi:NAD(P)-dependent dehydrogenase (short-subunit alcohol dehydrogenase family)
MNTIKNNFSINKFMQMKNRICLITGANSGIGKITARELAKQGMTILMVVRNKEKGEQARREIIQLTGNQHVELYICDLSVQADIVQVAGEIKARHTKIDVFINNAGLIVSGHQTSADGIEMTFAINHLGPFLLTNLLLDLIKNGEEPRIITVSSEAHRLSKLDFATLAAPEKYSAWLAYGNSKLANILFTRQLAKEVKKDGITANCLHPGAVATNFGAGYNGIAGTFFSLFRPFFISPEKGAETTIYLASSPEVKGITGLYFDKKKPKSPNKEALSDYNAQKLWEISITLTKLPERLKQTHVQQNYFTK